MVLRETLEQYLLSLVKPSLMPQGGGGGGGPFPNCLDASEQDGPGICALQKACLGKMPSSSAALMGIRLESQRSFSSEVSQGEGSRSRGGGYKGGFGITVAQKQTHGRRKREGTSGGSEGPAMAEGLVRTERPGVHC